MPKIVFRPSWTIPNAATICCPSNGVASISKAQSRILSTYAEIKAIASGNPAVVDKIKIDTEIRKLDQLRAVHANQQRHIRWEIRDLPRHIAEAKQRLVEIEADIVSGCMLIAQRCCPLRRQHSGRFSAAPDGANGAISGRLNAASPLSCGKVSQGTLMGRWIFRQFSLQ